ncbi:MAG: hypothetical protein A2W30_05645 [Ignavibacteria bacterium RBG_16_36_9]|nr:MAG: hypothetical protein A2W30_05645 [Ignavibacteria bacterium RBG_16_36_9]
MKAIAEIWRILRPGGEIYVEVPFLQPYHSSPDDYYRTTQEGLKFWMKDFKEIKTGICVGPGSTVAWIIIEYVRLWFQNLPIFGVIIEVFVRIAVHPLKYLDQFIIKKRETHITASAVYFHGKK